MSYINTFQLFSTPKNFKNKILKLFFHDEETDFDLLVSLVLVLEIELVTLADFLDGDFLLLYLY